MPTPLPGGGPLAWVGDVATDLMRPLTQAEENAAQKWIDQLTDLIVMRRPLLRTWIADGLLPANLVGGVITATVARKLLNPDGKSEEKIDDYSYRRSEATADGSLAISEADWDLLRPRHQGGRRRGSVRLIADWARR